MISVHGLLRLFRFTALRLLTLFLAVAVSVYLTMLVAGKGKPIESEMPGRTTQFTGWLSGIKEPRVRRFLDSGPVVPEVIRNLELLYDGLSLNLGMPSYIIISQSGSSQSGAVRDIIQDALPRTLLLFGTANTLIFFSSVFLALFLSRRYGTWLDRLTMMLTPLFSGPAWLYGLLLIVFAANVLHIYPKGFLDSWPPRFSLEFLAVLARHMLPPILALFISKFFLSVYTWRTFFLIYSTEDYIDLARAKGLPEKDIQRRYLLRPALPSFLTSFAMLVINIWQEAIVLELFFSIVGIGQVFYVALRSNDLPMIVGLTVTFAYLLALSVFILEFLYALVDPRIKVGVQGQAGRLAKSRGIGFRSLFQGRKAAPVQGRRWYATSQPVSPPAVSEKTPLASRVRHFWKMVGYRLSPLREIARYPSAIAGMAIIAGLVAISIYTLAVIPYDQAVYQWNNNRDSWIRNPELAPPVWVNLFNGNSLPRNIDMDSAKGMGQKTTRPLTGSMREVALTFPFDYPYKKIPQDILLYLNPIYDQKAPLVTVTWKTPDGREIRVVNMIVNQDLHYSPKLDEPLSRRLGGVKPIAGLFANPAEGEQDPRPVPGRYELRVVGTFFEENVDLNAEFLLTGQVYGLAGTDYYKRDLAVALLWGTPVALAFGVVDAIGTSLLTMLIAALGAWFGGWVDGLIQRITEVNMVLPAFPVLLIVYTKYSKSFWAILGVAVLLSIFGGSIKTYRSVFLQMKELPYVEAAGAYGAGSFRIIFHYLAPTIAPVLIPQLVILIPGYVYLETTMAYLNMSDPVLPTWGKVIKDALSFGALNGAYHWLLEPVGLLILTGFGFLMLGFALERILNPRLRDT